MPTQALALASIGVQQLRGDAVLNVISRSGDASFQEDFRTTSKQVGPGPKSLLGAARTASEGRASALVTAAEREATAWYAANSVVYCEGVAADYAAEVASVTGASVPARSLCTSASTPGAAAGYTALESNITQAISDDQARFQSSAEAGARSLNPREGEVIVASLLMAAGCVWGLSRRLAECR